MYKFIINFVINILGIVIGRVIFLKLDSKFLLKKIIQSKFKIVKAYPYHAVTTLLCLLVAFIAIFSVGFIWFLFSGKTWDLDKYGFVANFILFFFIGAQMVLTNTKNTI